jgi:hypothetical protein
MIDHHSRIQGVVKSALKRAALSDSFGYYVAPCIVPAMAQTPKGQTFGGFHPGWMVSVTIRDTNNLGSGDLIDGGSLIGSLPPDEAFEELAMSLYERLRDRRDQAGKQALSIIGKNLEAL